MGLMPKLPPTVVSDLHRSTRAGSKEPQPALLPLKAPATLPLLSVPPCVTLSQPPRQDTSLLLLKYSLAPRPTLQG